MLIILTMNHLQNTKDKVYIYESPDNGKTIYRREFGNYLKRELIAQKNDE